MRWVYILKCEDDYYYVGETTRLYRRFWEHSDGCGGINTSIYRPEDIVAIYKVNTLGKFFEYNRNVLENTYKSWQLTRFDDEVEYDYDHLEAENNITECLMLHNEDSWQKIRGGKYTRFIPYKFPNNDHVKELPICKCGVPCDIKKMDDHLFFRCAKKNMWQDLKETMYITDEPCNFYMEYVKDKEFRLEEIKKKENRIKTLKELFKKSDWLKNVPPNDSCVGGCNKSRGYRKLSYDNQELNLCYDCFIDKHDDLSKKYTVNNSKCLVKIIPQSEFLN